MFLVIAIGFSEPEYTVSEGNGSVTISIARRGVASVPISVEYFTEEGSATGLSSYHLVYSLVCLTCDGYNTVCAEVLRRQ